VGSRLGRMWTVSAVRASVLTPPRQPQVTGLRGRAPFAATSWPHRATSPTRRRAKSHVRLARSEAHRARLALRRVEVGGGLSGGVTRPRSRSWQRDRWQAEVRENVLHRRRLGDRRDNAHFRVALRTAKRVDPAGSSLTRRNLHFRQASCRMRTRGDIMDSVKLSHKS
jgi:hypothetical protein